MNQRTLIVVASLSLLVFASPSGEAQLQPLGPRPAPEQLQRPTLTAPPQPCTSATATSWVFLKLDGIQGESQDVCHSGEIELLSFQIASTEQRLDQKGRPVLGGRFTAGKNIDKTSPKLMVAAAMGRLIQTGTITLLTSSGQMHVYSMRNVLISSLTHTAGPTAREELVIQAGELSTQVVNANVSVQPRPASAAVDMFLKMTGIQGGSQDSAHNGEIVVTSLTWGLQVPLSGGFATGGAQFSDIIVQKSIDSASSALLQQYSMRRQIPEAIITLRQRGGADFFQFRLTDVVVSRFSQVGGASQQEQVGLQSAKIHLIYAPGQPGAVSAGWDLKIWKAI